MNTPIMQAFRDIVEQRQRWVTIATNDMLEIAPYAEALESIVDRYPGCHSYMSFTAFVIEQKVEHIRDITGVLEAVEAAVGREIYSSLDEPDGVYPLRTFLFRDFPLAVQATLPADENASDACHRVQTGQRIVPTYEIRCA